MAQFIKGYTIYKLAEEVNKYGINIKSEFYQQFVDEYEATLLTAKLLNWKFKIFRSLNSIQVIFYKNNVENIERALRLYLNQNGIIKNVIVTNRGHKKLNKETDGNLIESIKAIRLKL